MVGGGTAVPVISVFVQQINQLLGQTYSTEALSDTLERLGCDLDEVADIKLYQCPQCNVVADKLEHEDPPRRCNTCGHESETDFALVGTDKVIRLDLLPARPDLFDAGGLARAIKGYLNLQTGLPEYSVQPSGIKVTVDQQLYKAESYRPYIVCAVVTMPPVDSVLLRTLMKLQENLHWGIGRDRKLCAIGVHDLDAIQAPFRYIAVDPHGIKFHPLGRPDELMTPTEILQKHPKGVGYAHLLTPMKFYPILIDSHNQVLSMPPIINSNEPKIKIGTTRLFIDVTGITISDVQKALKTLVTSLIELGGQVQSVEIGSPNETFVTPDLTPGTIKINLNEARHWLGIDFSTQEAIEYLQRMRFSVQGTGNDLEVKYPAFRSDMKHEVDVFEDLAIAYGYHRMPMKLVPTMTVAKERPEEKISHIARDSMIGLGFSEIFSLMITTQYNHFDALRLPPKEYVLLLNSKAADYNIVRCHLMTGLLESLEKNRIKPTPQRFFELGNVLLLDELSETGTREERRLAFAIIGEKTGYAEGRAVLDAVLKELGITGTYSASNHPSFIEGRCAQIQLSNQLVAYLGEVHPQILQNFHLSYPVTMAEIGIMKVL